MDCGQPAVRIPGGICDGARETTRMNSPVGGKEVRSSISPGPSLRVGLPGNRQPWMFTSTAETRL